MILKNTKKRVLCISNVHIMPGVNVFDEEQTKRLDMELETVERFISLGIIESMDKDTSKPVINILEMDRKELIPLLKGMFDLKKLQAYKEKEMESLKPRSSVLNIIEKQIEKIDKTAGEDD